GATRIHSARFFWPSRLTANGLRAVTGSVGQAGPPWPAEDHRTVQGRPIHSPADQHGPAMIRRSRPLVLALTAPMLTVATARHGAGETGLTSSSRPDYQNHRACRCGRPAR